MYIECFNKTPQGLLSYAQCSICFQSRGRANLQESVEYLNTTSHGLVTEVLDYQRLQHSNVSAKIALTGIAPSTALRPAAHRSSQAHDWDFSCFGAWKDVVLILMGLFKLLGQNPAFSCFNFGNLTFTFHFVFPSQEKIWLHFILQSYFSLGKIKYIYSLHRLSLLNCKFSSITNNQPFIFLTPFSHTFYFKYYSRRGDATHYWFGICPSISNN